MQYSDLWLSITGMVFNLLPFWIFLYQGTANFRQVRRFLSLNASVLLINLIAVIYSRIIPITEQNAWAALLVSAASSLAVTAVPYFVYAYIYSLFYYDDSGHTYSIKAVVGLAVSLAAVILFGPEIVLEHRSLVLNGMKGTLLLIIPALYFLSISVAEGIRHESSLNRSHIRALRIMLFLCVVSVVVFKILRKVSVYGFLLTLVPILAQYTMQGKGTLIDPVTGLRSRNAWHISMTTRMQGKKAFRVILIHIPDLSAIAASLDETNARSLMGRVAEILTGIAKNCPVFRIGDDCFAILENEVDERAANEMEIDLASRFRSPLYAGGEQKRIHVLASTISYPDDVRNMEDLDILTEMLDDHASKVRESEEVMIHLDLEKEKEMRSAVHAVSSALLSGRLEVFYQPIINLNNGRFESAEALIRMKDEKGSYVSPGSFIPAAERSGIIVRIGRFVLDEVCRLMEEEHLRDLGVHYVEVNLSVEESIQENITDVMRRIMETHHTDPSALNIEVTETANETASELMFRNIEMIHNDLGLELSLDDFGTGYSNLSRMLSMPVSIIKFDRSLLLKAFETEKGRIMFERLAGMVHAVGRRIVCEGVETAEQAEFVKANRIEYIQGFYYARPMPAASYVEFLKEHAA